MPDPLESLRLPETPEAPRPEFAAALRGRLEAALGLWPPDPATTSTTTRSTAMSTTETATTQVLIPYLCVHDSVAALAFYRDAFGAFETMRVVGDDGRMGHCEFTIGGARFMMADEFPEIDVVSPRTLGGTPMALYLDVVDVDHVHDQAVAGGAESLAGPADQTHGNRTATILDPFGHRWMLAQTDRAAQHRRVRRPRSGLGRLDGQRQQGPRRARLPHLPDRRSRQGEGLLRPALRVGDPGGQHGRRLRPRRQHPFPMGFMPTGDGEIRSPSTSGSTTSSPTPPRSRPSAAGSCPARDYASGGNAECEDDQGFRFELHQPAPGY